MFEFPAGVGETIDKAAMAWVRGPFMVNDSVCIVLVVAFSLGRTDLIVVGRAGK